MAGHRPPTAESRPWRRLCQLARSAPVRRPGRRRTRRCRGGPPRIMANNRHGGRSAAGNDQRHRLLPALMNRDPLAPNIRPTMPSTPFSLWRNTSRSRGQMIGHQRLTGRCRNSRRPRECRTPRRATIWSRVSRFMGSAPACRSPTRASLHTARHLHAFHEDARRHHGPVGSPRVSDLAHLRDREACSRRHHGSETRVRSDGGQGLPQRSARNALMNARVRADRISSTYGRPSMMRLPCLRQVRSRNRSA